MGITPDVDVEPPKETLASLTQSGAELDQSVGEKKDKGPAGGESAAPAPGADKGDKRPAAKGAKKEEKDVQLDRAIDILKHWNTFKLQLAKGESQQAAGDTAKSKGD